jgi:hypothetical protein
MALGQNLLLPTGPENLEQWVSVVRNLEPSGVLTMLNAFPYPCSMFAG